MNRTGIFSRGTQRARILLTDNVQSGGSCSVNGDNGENSDNGDNSDNGATVTTATTNKQ